MNTHWDVIVIGAGMSGLGAGIRLAMAGKKVLLLEQHNSVGGLNGFYVKDKILYDVGLHAMTNFVPAGSRGHPLTKLCRQLRIPYEAFKLEQQRQSRIQFPDVALTFNNHFPFLVENIRQHFPKQIDGFLKLDAAVESTPDTALDGSDFISARNQMRTFINDQLLTEMLLLPLFYYGSAHTNDLDWRQFAILYKAIYKEGFARPKCGVRTICRLLVDRYRTCGGVLELKTAVRSILLNGSRAVGVELASGEILHATQILSSVGYRETQVLCGKAVEGEPSRLSFAETITTYEATPEACGWNDTITFFNTFERVAYEPTETLLDLRSGVICIPENYGDHAPDGSFSTSVFEPMVSDKFRQNPAVPSSAMPFQSTTQRLTLRTTHLAGYDAWKNLSPEVYREQKKACLNASRVCAFNILRGQSPKTVLAEDMFTPLTVERFTGHINGAIYGSTKKFRDGRIGYENLFLCGTDQGFLGIVGALLSGISMANYHCLKG